MSSELSQGGGEVQWLKEWLMETAKWRLEGWQRGVGAVLCKRGSGEAGQNRSWRAVATTSREWSLEPAPHSSGSALPTGSGFALPHESCGSSGLRQGHAHELWPGLGGKMFLPTKTVQGSSSASAKLGLSEVRSTCPAELMGPCGHWVQRRGCL